VDTLVSPIEIPAIPQFATDAEKLAWLCARHDELEHEVAELRIRNAIWQHQLYGKKSEKVRASDDAAGQERLFDVPVADDATGPDAGDESTKPKRKRGQAAKRDHARKPVNPELARVERVHGADGPRHAADGNELTITGWDVRERLHHIPEQVVCLVDRYAIWGLPDTRETAETTPVAPAIIPGGKLSDDFLCEIARRKYLLSQPLYRQLLDYNALEADLAVSTMCDGMRALAGFLEPIHRAMELQILAASVVHIDETTMRQQCDAHGSVIRYLWAWHAAGQVSFHYGTRSADEIRAILARAAAALGWGCPDPGPPRYALTDGYAAYDRPLADAGFIHAGCWAHIRRDFKQIAGVFTHAREIFAAITELYRCEKAATKAIAKAGLRGPEADACRLRYRQERAQPALDAIADLVERYRPLYKPKGPMGEALTTLANQFAKLRVYATTGHVPIDNNEVERDMRRVAVGRKNYLFVGSEDAGAWCATLYSLIESCRISGIDVRAYLGHAVAGLHAGQDPAELTPARAKAALPKAKRKP